ncbi:glycosyltransferase [Terriglobus roseus DSM 18391]|uniref:Glycosyltransferase n=1 Tax=Terriglobus roseus (strain DSM 18391 / NRRL B-41598 / KBS 63) TaxID=926566 RepID=I3ZE96_TERRK|nr:glycosyltransferase family 4 protein [Terriglobus roseus]AFL87564.1 glycosyltransferase [Terriglobus roseus DSM 18391]
MTIAAMQATAAPGTPEGTRGARPSVWLADPFCFTPWYTAALAGALRDAGTAVRLISASIAREPNYFARSGLTADPGPIRWDRCADHWHPRVRKTMRAAAAIANTLILTRTLERKEAGRPNILHLQQLPALNHGVSFDFDLIAAAQRYGIPVVHTVHNLLPHDTGEQLRPVYQRLYSVVDHLICHSTDIAQALRGKFGVDADAITVIPHGPLFEEVSTAEGLRVDARQRLGIERKRPVALWQGVLAPYKGLDLLLDSWKRSMSTWDPGAGCPLLLIAGSGSAAEEELVQRTARLHPDTIRADLRYIATEEIPHYYRVADVILYPYRSITTSGALLTGLSYCKPIVAFDLAPFRQYLQHGSNAVLVPPGDDVLLTKVLSRLLREVAAMRDQTAMSCSGTQPSDVPYPALLQGAMNNRLLYTGWDEIAARTVKVYGQLLGGASKEVCNTLHTV